MIEGLGAWEWHDKTEQDCSGCWVEGQKASGVKPGDQLGAYYSHANRGNCSLDQVIGSGGDEKWLDFGFIWKIELVGFTEQ